MTARDDEALIAGLSKAARRVAAQDAEGSGAPGPAPEAWHRLQKVQKAHDRRPRSSRAALRWALPTVAVAACALAAGGWLARRRHPLTFVVSGGVVEANGYVVRAGLEPTELRFSDGTRVSLARGARMSVGAPGPRGARLRVEDGQAHFEVTHRPGADWSVEAGPYRVQVTGTVFDVRWSGADESAAVGLRQGSVRVTGPNLAAPVVLVAGQRLVARLSTGQVRLESGGLDATSEPTAEPTRDARPRDPTPVAPRPAAAMVVPPVHAALAARPGRSAAAKPPAPAVGPSTWAARVASGESAAVLAEARAAVFDDVIGSVDAQALGALADAARYSGARDLSTRALVELRRRFPETGGARAAAFQLGRMADDGGDARAALDWYRRYQSEAPRGPYAAEAVGREMIAVERLSGRAAAAPIARAYLERFPDGTYLLQARAILGMP
jgi:ferric-dicitrate binding protein FerR (iron transport regulator)